MFLNATDIPIPEGMHLRQAVRAPTPLSFLWMKQQKGYGKPGLTNTPYPDVLGLTLARAFTISFCQKMPCFRHHQP